MNKIQAFQRAREFHGRCHERIAGVPADIASAKEFIAACYKEAGGKMYVESGTDRYMSFTGGIPYTDMHKTYTFWNSVSVDYFKGDLGRIVDDLSLGVYKTSGGDPDWNMQRFQKELLFYKEED